MTISARPSASRKTTSNLMRPPPIRPSVTRERSATPALTGRVSPADSLSSATTTARRARSPTNLGGGTKRKERDFEQDAGWETNINVVVRCRGRSEREVRENSGVVVSTDGVTGKKVEISMGPTALNNKIYPFDKVFSPAADQTMIFDQVVVPILDEVLAGYNCTIFAYGQTGTGKTYTMSGDISDTRPLQDAAGIIPRVLHYLFDKLDGDGTENSVKCSFIELYNEELRDLLSVEENAKLKIFEDGSRKGHGATLVQGMEESHILSPSKGIQLLREGSRKRQVAATKCNDLSSRSHTVFTITVYLKQTSETGEDFVSAGKLNLVDLAGSENVQRSGAENKRAAEAGLINKSLLTLGRVINALVDKSSHIPYRESKLTRLLQDSLGGRTKTCIIATLSPAKSNLEETVSTLDYAFRAKNIRNKPQVNQVISKKTLLKEFALEIEKLKSELIATRHRNGVYLTAEMYDQLITESESRRILGEEQRDKIDTMEVNLRNKLQELFSLTNNFNVLKRDHEAARLALDGTVDLLEKTEIVLALTQRNLEEEAMLRKAHEETEESLAAAAYDMISTLGRTTSDVEGLHSKLRRRSDLQSVNREAWATSRQKMVDATSNLDGELEAFRGLQKRLMGDLCSKMQAFVREELRELGESQALIRDSVQSFEDSEAEVSQETKQGHENIIAVVNDMYTLREDLKTKAGAGLDELAKAAQRISEGIVTQLDTFQAQLFSSFTMLGRDLKSIFDDALQDLQDQETMVSLLRENVTEAEQKLQLAGQAARNMLLQVQEEENRKAAEERQYLLAQMSSLINETGDRQQRRLAEGLVGIDKSIERAVSEQRAAQNEHTSGLNAWCANARTLTDKLERGRHATTAQIETNLDEANTRAASLREDITSVHEETVRLASAQMVNMDGQLQAMDDVVSRVRRQNDVHHHNQVSSAARLGNIAKGSLRRIGDQFSVTSERMLDLEKNLDNDTEGLEQNLTALDPAATIRARLRALREDVGGQELAEYISTGDTPQRRAYAFPTKLPRTEDHQRLIARLRGCSQERASDPSDSEAVRSPSKAVIFVDRTTAEDYEPPNLARSATAATTTPSTLRERDVNVPSGPVDLLTSPMGDASAMEQSAAGTVARKKRQNTHTQAGALESGRIEKKSARKTVAGISALVADGRENMPVGAMSLSSSVGPMTGRRLRSNAVK